MKNDLDYLQAISKAAIENMKANKILASFTIAVAISCLNSVSESDVKVLLAANNVMKIKAGKKYNSDHVMLDSVRGVRYKRYDSIQDCLNDWLLTFKSSLIKEVWDLKQVISLLKNSVNDCSAQQLLDYSSAYKLTVTDNEILNELYPTNQSIVEAPLSSASIYQEFSGYTPKDESPVSKVPIVASVKKSPIRLIKGEKIVVNNINIFKEPASAIASRSFTGNVWLYNGIEINHRYAIVTNKENLGKSRDFIDGYVKKSDII